MTCLDNLQVTKDMWHLFEQEFRSLWTAAVKQGKGGELALDVLYGAKAPAGTEILQVGILSYHINLHAVQSFCRKLCMCN